LRCGLFLLKQLLFILLLTVFTLNNRNTIYDKLHNKITNTNNDSFKNWGKKWIIKVQYKISCTITHLMWIINNNSFDVNNKVYNDFDIFVVFNIKSQLAERRFRTIEASCNL
jgi:hypothetical protein